MTNKTSLNLDVDFIKNFEELKLKQRILIETLKNKEKNKEEVLISEINSKLDFLVNLFKDAEGNDEDDFQFDKLNKRLDEMEKKIEKSIEKVFEKINLINPKSITEIDSSSKLNFEKKIESEILKDNLDSESVNSDKFEKLNSKIKDLENLQENLNDNTKIEINNKSIDIEENHKNSIPLPDFKYEGDNK